MALTKIQKEQIVKAFRKSDLDTGSSEVQVALLTYRIKDLTEHFKTHKKDIHGRRGLIKLVNQRKKLLTYLKRQSLERYTKVVKDLGLRG